MAIPVGAHCGQCENFVWPQTCRFVQGTISKAGHCRLFNKAGTDPFGEPASRSYLATARDAIAEVLTRFFRAEAPRIAADVAKVLNVLSGTQKRAFGTEKMADEAETIVNKADHTDPDQHGVEPIEDPHRAREISAAVAAALASIDWSRWSDLVGEISPHLEDAALHTVDDTLAAVHASLTPSETEAVHGEARAWAKARAAELVGQRRIGGRVIPDTSADKDITDSTARMIAETVREAIVERSASEELAAALENSRAFSPARAKLIADTETKTALHTATVQAFKASRRVRGSYWVTAHDERVESVCLINELASPVPLGHPFPSGHTAPLAHTGCRCFLIPWM